MPKTYWIFSAVLYLTIGLVPAGILAEVVVFTNVKLYSRATPESTLDKKEGYLNLDKAGKAIVFVADNEVLLTIPYPWVRNLSYDAKNAHRLTIHYRDSNDQWQFAQLELGGSNRDQILAFIEADTGVNLSRAPTSVPS